MHIPRDSCHTISQHRTLQYANIHKKRGTRLEVTCTRSFKSFSATAARALLLLTAKRMLPFAMAWRFAFSSAGSQIPAASAQPR